RRRWTWRASTPRRARPVTTCSGSWTASPRGPARAHASWARRGRRSGGGAGVEEGGGGAVVRVVGGPLLLFSEGFDCARCGRTFEEPQPRLFSFNNPFGACATCHAFGHLIEIDPHLVS